jgi:hypothetical protein
MNKELYIKLKTIFKHYKFDDEANFFRLFKFAKHAGLRGVSFHQFSKHAQAMGVKSIVRRVDGVVKRSLIYDTKADEYLKAVFPEFETCPTCKGKGIVQINLTETK